MELIQKDASGQFLLFPVRGFGTRKPDKPPPAHHGVDTSQAGAQAVAAKVPSRKDLALRLIEAAGDRGLTNHELAAATGWLLASTTPITSTLASEGKVKDSGRRRPSPSGVASKVFVVAKGDRM